MRFTKNQIGIAVAIALASCTGTKPLVVEPVAATTASQDTLEEFLAPALPADEDDRAEMRTLRDQRITELEKIYETDATEMGRAQAIYELTKLHQERAFDILDQAKLAYSIEYDRYQIGETTVVPVLKLERFNEAQLTRMNLLRDMAGNFPHDPRYGEVLWQIASTMAHLGNAHCEDYFKQAERQAINPDLANKVHLSEADWQAANNKWAEAIKIYGDVRDGIKDSSDPLKAYAAYRLGLAYLSKNDKAKAEAALKLAFLTAKEDEHTYLGVRTESAHQLAKLWAEAGNEKAAQAFAETHSLPMFMNEYREDLASNWLSQNQYPKVIAYYKELIAKAPLDPRVTDWRLKIALTHVATGDLGAMQTEVAALVKMTSDPKNPWFDEHGDDEQLVGRAKKIINLLPLASGFKTFNQALAEKDTRKQRPLMTAAIKTLQDQQKTVTDPEQALALRMTLVQGFVALNRDEEALTQLDGIVKLGAKAGPHLADAAYMRLELLVKMDGEQKYKPLPALGDVKKPIALPALKQRFATAVDEYLAIVPNADNKVNLRFQVAQDLFSYGHYDKALPLFEALANEFPRTEQAKVGIEYLLSMNLKANNFPELVRLATGFLNNRNVRGKDLRAYIKQNLDWAKQQMGGGAGATAH